MNNHLNTIYGAKKLNLSSLYAEHYVSMDLCSQAQLSEDANNILSRMDKLRIYANEQRVKSQRRQTSFCF